jgi:hypothetical protein
MVLLARAAARSPGSVRLAAGVAVAVVDVRPVRMGVLEALVAVRVRVARRGGEPRVRVIVVAVVVGVAVHVDDGLVHVAVRVPAAEQGGEREREERRRRRVLPADRLAEDREGEGGADEGRAREDALRARRAELLGGRDVERDAGPVAERPRRERRRRDGGRRSERIGQGAEREGRRAGAEPLHERARGRGDPVDERGPVVVEPPADAGRRDEQRRDESGPAAGSGQDRAGGDHAADARPAQPADVLAEERDPEHGGRDHLEVEQQRDRAGVAPAQAEQHQERPEEAAEEHGAGEAPGVRAAAGGTLAAPALARDDGRHGERRAEVEQAGELERGELAEQGLAGRRRRAEEHGREQREEQGVHDATPAERPARGPLGATRYPRRGRAHPPRRSPLRAPGSVRRI